MNLINNKYGGKKMSMNDWKALETKYNIPDFLQNKWSTVYKIWTKEGKP